MRGLLSDVNLQGDLPYLIHALETIGLMPYLRLSSLEFVTFPDLGLHQGTADRLLWNYCQVGGWVLWTKDRNEADPDSLESTLKDSWKEACLPVLTIADKRRFELNRDYALRAAADLADILFGIACDRSLCHQPRFYVPRFWP